MKYDSLIYHVRLEIVYWQETYLLNRNDLCLVELALDSRAKLFNTLERLYDLQQRSEVI